MLGTTNPPGMGAHVWGVHVEVHIWHAAEDSRLLAAHRQQGKREEDTRQLISTAPGSQPASLIRGQGNHVRAWLGKLNTTLYWMTQTLRTGESGLFFFVHHTLEIGNIQTPTRSKWFERMVGLDHLLGNSCANSMGPIYPTTTITASSVVIVFDAI